MLEQCPVGDRGRPGAGLSISRQEACKPRNRPWFVLACDNFPTVKCSLALKLCVLEAVPGRVTSKDRLLFFFFFNFILFLKFI